MMKRKSFGSTAYIGYMYDARKEEVLNMSIFTKSQLPPSLVQTYENPNTNYQFTFEDSNEEKFKNLNVQAELKVDILCGLVPLNGSGNYKIIHFLIVFHFWFVFSLVRFFVSSFSFFQYSSRITYFTQNLLKKTS